MENRDLNDINDFEKIVRENVKAILVQLVLCFYHKFGYLEESYDQIFNTIVDYLIIPEKDIKILRDIVLKELETRYYYKLQQYDPVKFKSILWLLFYYFWML